MPSWNKMYFKLSGRLILVSHSCMMVWQEKLNKPQVALVYVRFPYGKIEKAPLFIYKLTEN